MMELRDFVSQTLIQIIDGVVAAQKHAKQHGAAVNPQICTGSEVRRAFPDAVPVQDVELDIAITAVEGTETKGGIGVFIGSVGLGAQGKSDASQTTVSRVKFAVAVALPRG